MNAKAMHGLVTAKAAHAASVASPHLLVAPCSAGERLRVCSEAFRPSSPLPFNLHPIDRPRPLVVHHPSLRKTTCYGQLFSLTAASSLLSFVQQPLLCPRFGALVLGIQESPRHRYRSFVRARDNAKLSITTTEQITRDRYSSRRESRDTEGI